MPNNSNTLFDLSRFSTITVSGPRASEFLQGQLTCDVNQVTAHQIQAGALCNLKGRILAMMEVVDWQGLKLVLPADLAADPYADLPPPEPREFSIGEVRFRATNVCRRCPVPARDSRTGVVTEHFRDAFEARRRRGLRPDVDAGAWGTLYRLGVNTVGDGHASPVVRRGDVLTSAP